MAREIVMPQLSLSMDKGQIVNWLKQTGDKIAAGDILLEVESDKATIEVESVESGVLQILLWPNDGEISVGTVIAYALGEGESPVTVSPTALPAMKAAGIAEPTPSAAAPVDNGQQFGGRLPSSPAARRKAAELQIDWQQVTGTGRGGRIKERDILRFSQEQAQSAGPQATPAGSIQLTPLARRMADSFGLHDASLAALIPDKAKIERDDVEEAIRKIVRERQSATAALATPSLQRPLAVVGPRREAMGLVRKRIAGRMTVSSQTYAPVTLTTEIDATELIRLRETLKGDPHVAVAPGYNVLIVKITAKALCEHPTLNASLEGGEIIYWPTINIGLAVDTARGLVVPVVRDVAAKSVNDLACEMKDLLGRAAQGAATVDELTGGTFTITNLGVQDIDAFTPIINPPECAVLGIGRLRKQVTVVNDAPAVRTMLVLSLTFDHRLVDGAPAARFLQRVKELLENPYLCSM